jgi:TPR repeat protein
VPVGHRSIVGFPDNVGHLSAGGADGWGRAFSEGLLCAASGGYDYVVHVEGDLLTRLDVPAICRMMRERRIDALGAVTPCQGWLETGLFFLAVDYVRRARLVERYDWSRRPPYPYPEAVLGELLGGDLFLQLWRGAKDDGALLSYGADELHWLTKVGDPTAYDRFMASGPWPVPDPREPAGLASRIETKERYRELASGLANVQHCLGLMYEKGQGVPQDYAEAARLFRLAAEQDNAPAQNNLAFLYVHGRGVPQDNDKAMRWFRKAADQGSIPGQTNLGLILCKVSQDYTEGARWYRAAADQGSAAAQTNLATLYYEGKGVPLDHAEAAKWYRRAADQGDALGQYNLGALYANGKGVTPDLVQAYLWLELAAARQEPAAANSRSLVAARMTPAELETARALVAAWRPADR